MPGTYDSDAERALAWVDVLGGTRSHGLTRLRAVAARQADEGQRALELQTRHDAYRLGDRMQATAILELTEHIDGTWSSTVRAHVEALEPGDGRLLERAAAGFEAQGALLLAAETEAETAMAFRSEGLKAREAAARRRSADLVRRCGGVRTPLLDEVDAPVDLTRREREIVELAAGGRSNAEIADHLVLSVRTVEGHLLRAFAKLGVTNRAALAAVLRSSG
jgi:DNA-binding CsgD family transcriptional regulator